jgi:hypothetical protein
VEADLHNKCEPAAEQLAEVITDRCQSVSPLAPGNWRSGVEADLHNKCEPAAEQLAEVITDRCQSVSPLAPGNWRSEGCANRWITEVPAP